MGGFVGLKIASKHQKSPLFRRLRSRRKMKKFVEIVSNRLTIYVVKSYNHLDIIYTCARVRVYA